LKPTFDVYLVGRASDDAKMEQAGDRPVCKFFMWVGSGKNKKTGEWQKPFSFPVKCWGDSAKTLKKGQDIELFGYMVRNEYTDKQGVAKTWDEVVVKTNEKGQPMINFAGLEWGGTKGVSDEAVASGKAPVRNLNSKLEITDEDIPF
jgi:single-stranded DNA-binding protein